MGYLVGQLREWEEEEQFLGRKEEIRWPLGRSVRRMEGGQILGGRNRIRKEKVFHSQDLVAEVRRKLI